jgi:hypothetical protein
VRHWDGAPLVESSGYDHGHLFHDILRTKDMELWRKPIEDVLVDNFGRLTDEFGRYPDESGKFVYYNGGKKIETENT